MIVANARPTYYTQPYILPANLGNPRPVAGRFSVIEVRNGEHAEVFNINKYGLTLNELLKRGIPLDNARALFYDITA